MTSARDPGTVTRLVVRPPNWLGDAVMALPALADVRRASPGVPVAVAARPSVAPIFRLVPGLVDVIELDARGPLWQDRSASLRAGQFDGALLLPNSFHAALAARRAGIRERWGYASDLRRPLLTRHAAAPARVHQAAYYQHLTAALGFAAGPLQPGEAKGACNTSGSAPAEGGGTAGMAVAALAVAMSGQGRSFRVGRICGDLLAPFVRVGLFPENAEAFGGRAEARPGFACHLCVRRAHHVSFVGVSQSARARTAATTSV